MRRSSRSTGVLGATFVGAMFARSFKELTFVTVAVSVFLTAYTFVPAIFTQVTPIALISPLTLVVRDLTGQASGSRRSSSRRGRRSSPDWCCSLWGRSLPRRGHVHSAVGAAESPRCARHVVSRPPERVNDEYRPVAAGHRRRMAAIASCSSSSRCR